MSRDTHGRGGAMPLPISISCEEAELVSQITAEAWSMPVDQSHVRSSRRRRALPLLQPEMIPVAPDAEQLTRLGRKVLHRYFRNGHVHFFQVGRRWFVTTKELRRFINWKSKH